MINPDPEELYRAVMRNDLRLGLILAHLGIPDITDEELNCRAGAWCAVHRIPGIAERRCDRKATAGYPWGTIEVPLCEEDLTLVRQMRGRQ